jgi:hypothetical protein
MNCARARFLVYAYLDRDLPRGEADSLSRHLTQCPACAARRRSARSLMRLLRSRLDYAPAPIGLRERLHAGRLNSPYRTPSLKAGYAPVGIAASLLLLILPLVADQHGPRSAAVSLATPVAVASAPSQVVPVSKKLTGIFVCLQCEGRHGRDACPLGQVHEIGFCADNGETWRIMSNDAAFTSAAVGQAATLEGIAFPESGFLRASRVGY